MKIGHLTRRTKRALTSLISTLDGDARGSMLRQLRLDPQLRYAYIEIPKAACSSVKLTMAALGSVYKNQEGPSQSALHGRNANWLTYRDWDFLASVERFHQSGNPLFTIVRNPFTRALSAYREKIEIKTEGPRYQEALGFEPDRDVSFEAFLTRITRLPTQSLDPHFKPQSEIAPRRILPLNFIGSVEALEHSLDHFITEYLGRSRVSIRDRRPHKTGSSDKANIEKYFTPSATQLVLDIYGPDFDEFGYAPDLSLIDSAPSPGKAETVLEPAHWFHLSTAATVEMNLRCLANQAVMRLGF